MTNLSVTIGANVTDLHTKMALAQADVRGLNTEVRDLTNQMATASDEMQGGLLAKLETAVSSLSTAKTHVGDLRKELDELTPSTEHAGGAFVTLRETTEGINARLTETKALASGLGEVFLAGLGGEKLFELAEGAAKFGETMEVASHETGLSTAALQGLSFAANRQSVEFDTLERGIAKMAQTTQQATRTRSRLYRPRARNMSNIPISASRFCKRRPRLRRRLGATSPSSSRGSRPRSRRRSASSPSTANRCSSRTLRRSSTPRTSSSRVSSSTTSSWWRKRN
jgi:hypothetical protein